MSKYLSKGRPVPYHFVDYADSNSEYHAHVQDLVARVGAACRDIPESSTFHVHEVGCGEGLILYRLWLVAQLVFATYAGNDADKDAVRMANTLLPPFIKVFHEDRMDKRPPGDEGLLPQVVLFADSLEHINTWRKHLEWAQRKASVIVIAVPSEPDKYAVNQFGSKSFDDMFGGWKLAHRKTREARHLSIWVKP